MKILKVVYSNDTKYILDIVSQLKQKIYLESYNISNYKEKKKALPIMTRHGTGNTPLVVLADENLIEYNAVWSESNPDWLEEITKKLND